MGEGGQHSDHIKNYLLLQKVSFYKRKRDRETVGKHFEVSLGRDLNLWLNDWLNKEKIKKKHQQMGKKLLLRGLLQSKNMTNFEAFQKK